MDLHSAISKAVKFVWGGKQNSPLKNIRFLPSSNPGDRPRIYANKGQVGVMLEVDVPDLPNASLSGEALASIVQATKSLSWEWEVERQKINFVDDSGAKHTVALESTDEYPAIPPVPYMTAWYTTMDWWAVEQVMHAVSKDKQQPHLQCVNFNADSIEATDRMRVARSFITGLPIRGMVSSETFKHWPANLDTIDMALTDDQVAWFRLGEEIRLSCLQRGHSFPDLSAALPLAYDGPAVAVETDEILAAVKKAAATKVEGVTLVFNPQVQGLGLAAGGFSTALNTVVTKKSPVPVELRVNAKWLLAALKVCETPRVSLGYGNGLDPLRVESGPFVEGIWPIAGA